MVETNPSPEDVDPYTTLYSDEEDVEQLRTVSQDEPRGNNVPSPAGEPRMDNEQLYEEEELSVGTNLPHEVVELGPEAAPTNANRSAAASKNAQARSSLENAQRPAAASKTATPTNRCAAASKNAQARSSLENAQRPAAASKNAAFGQDAAPTNAPGHAAASLHAGTLLHRVQDLNKTDTPRSAAKDLEYIQKWSKVVAAGGRRFPAKHCWSRVA